MRKTKSLHWRKETFFIVFNSARITLFAQLKKKKRSDFLRNDLSCFNALLIRGLKREWTETGRIFKVHMIVGGEWDLSLLTLSHCYTCAWAVAPAPLLKQVHPGHYRLSGKLTDRLNSDNLQVRRTNTKLLTDFDNETEGWEE